MIGNSNKGFTLIEMLIAVTIFTVVVGTGSGVFISALRAQQAAFAEQELVESTRFAIEYMSRQIRLAQRDSSGSCTGTANTFYAVSGDNSSLAFINSQSQCMIISLSATDDISVSIDGATAVLITSHTAVAISDLTFIISGEARSDTLQPRVTISMEARGVGAPEGIEPITNLQTTVSARSIDV